MKVAIIGGGFSGLACAHELERLGGVKPVIFEKKSFIGEPFNHVTAVLEIINRPIKDIIKYFKKEYEIEITPLNELKTIIHHTPHKTTVVRGNLGYLLKNTAENDSVKVQILGKLKKTEIRLNEEGDMEKLSREFDHVAVATGNYAYAYEKGLWQEWFRAYVRGAVVHGDFDPQTLVMWLNKDYCKNGYAYLAPFSSKKAALVLVVTDVDEKEADHYWELFLYSENIKHIIIDEFKLEHRAGLVYPLTVGNIIFIGNAAGMLDPFLGFGHFNTIVTGASAARTMVKGIDYEWQLRDIIRRNHDMREFRKVYNTLTNKGYDNVLSVLEIPGLKKLFYSFPLNINIVKIGSFLSRLLYTNNRLGK